MKLIIKEHVGSDGKEVLGKVLAEISSPFIKVAIASWLLTEVVSTDLVVAVLGTADPSYWHVFGFAWLCSILFKRNTRGRSYVAEGR